MEDALIIGNNLPETAYHETGHIVAAAVLGLDLRPKGITIWEAAQDVMDGLARYWESETDWGKNLQSIRAGGLAQWRQFPGAYIGGQKPDIENFNKLSQSISPEPFPSICGKAKARRPTMCLALTGMLLSKLLRL